MIGTNKLATLLIAMAPLTTQAITLNPGDPYAENFDSMGNSGTSTPTDWVVIGANPGTGATWTSAISASNLPGGTANSTVVASTSYSSTSSTGGFNYALAATPTDRSLGTSPTGTQGNYLQLTLTNGAASPVSLLQIGYDIRRFTTSASANELPGYWLFYSLNGGTTWTNIPEFNPTISGPSGVIVPNATGVTNVPLTPITLNSPWASGATLRLRWVDDNSSTATPDQMIGLDNLTITSSAPVGQPPTVALTAPSTQDSFTAPATISLSADATDSDGTITKVEFYNGTTKLGEDTTAPYTHSWSGVNAGTYNLGARATDNDANLVAASAVSIFVESSSAGSGALTRNPYLQKAGSNRMTIRWRSSLSVRGRVNYGTAINTLSTVVNESAIRTDHDVELTGLSPNTTYFYSIGSATDTLAGGDPNHTFTTPPSPGTAIDTRIWVLGDAGTGFTAQYNVRDAFYTWTGSRTPNLVLQLGDNAYNAGTDSEYQASVFNVYGSLMRKTPFWSCLGNHETNQSTAYVDTYPYFSIYTMPTAGECGGESSGTEHYFSFDYGNIHFISLDTMTASRSPTGAMATWLQNDLASTTATWIIAFFHHPPFTKGSHNSDAEADLIEVRTNLLPILEAGGVDLVLCGHSHSYERSYLIDGHYGASSTFNAAMKINGGDGRPLGNGAYLKPLTGPRDHFGAVYTVTGSAGGQAAAGSLNHPAMFLSLNVNGSFVLDVNGTQVNATFIRENGTITDTFTLIKQGAADKDADGMADEWEISNNLNRNNPADAALDADGDRMSNLEEFIAGTNPQSNASRFIATASRTETPGQIAIAFSAQPGKTYTVRYKDAITDPTWTVLQQVAAVATPNVTTIYDTPPVESAKRFYHVATPAQP